MPGPYAHITLLHELMRPARPDSIFLPSSVYHTALVKYFPYCALGAVSPDYPNLARADSAAARWADAMHCTRACQMIASGIGRVRSSKGVARDKQLAWLLGYCAHVVMDATIHPVVEAMVGRYAENQRQHRICEMNQDSHIYRRMKLGEIGESGDFAVTVAQCSDSDDRTSLDRNIIMLWQGMLEDVHPELSIEHPPDIASWHREFDAMISGSGAAATGFFPLAGVIASKMGLDYPAFHGIDRLFVEKQMVPSKKSYYLHYDDIFDHAVGNVATVWRQIGQALCADDPARLPTFGGWNLDTGRDELGRLVFW